MRNKRVLIIRNAAQSDFGGGERFPVFLAMALNNLGWQPIIVSRSEKLSAFAESNSITHKRGWWWSRQNWSGSRILLTPLYFVWQALLFAYYLGIFASRRPAVVHLQSKDDFIAGTLAARTLGIRVVWTDHADLKHVWRNLRVWYKNPIGKAVYRAAHLAHAITVVSESEEDLVTKHLKRSSAIRDKITVVYNGAFDKRSDYPYTDSENVRFIVASRLVFDKGIQEAVEAFNELSKNIEHVTLTILGDGPDRAQLETLPGSENVTFVGHIDEPLHYLAQSDVFVHPTYHEGFSVALVEASMMSLPIIATSVGGNVEIVHNQKTGLLVPARDSKALYEAMKTLAHDEKARKLYGTNARRQYLQKFEFEKIVHEQFIPLYEGKNS